MPSNVAKFAEDWSLPLQEVQLWVCLRELTMHAVMTRPGVRSSLNLLLADASAHAAAVAALHGRAARRRAGRPVRPRGGAERSRVAAGRPHQPRAAHISNALTALTTSIGAYVDHVTAGIAATLTSSPAALREAWYRYRVEDAKGEQAFAGLFGLNVGQAEVDRGASFIDGVVERAGEEALSPPVGRRARPAHAGRSRRAGPVAGPHRPARLTH